METKVDISNDEETYRLPLLDSTTIPHTARHRNYSASQDINSLLQHGSLTTSSFQEDCGSTCEDACYRFYKSNQGIIRYILLSIGIVLYIAFVVGACIHNFEKAHSLFVITMVAAVCVIYTLLNRLCGRWINRPNNIFQQIGDVMDQHWRYLRWFVYISLVVALGCWLGFDTAKKPRRLISFGGLLSYIFIGYVFSKNRRKIIWRPVIWGFFMQFVFGILVLRTSPGKAIFKSLGDAITSFLAFSNDGAKFLFGDIETHPFAFKVLPVAVFFSSFIYMVYYLGVMQVVIKKIATLMQFTMGTSAAESLSAAGNIFIGQTEAPLLIRPFLNEATMSELHAIMTGGFATIGGSVLGAYISKGISATHLISASVMSGPASLALSKLMYPETEEPKTKRVKDIDIPKGKESSFIEAFAVGASMSIGLVANIAVNLIAFVALLSFSNGILMWCGGMIGIPNLTFELICSYVCMPFAYLMGVEWNDAFKVGELLGVKTFLNEFVAYDRLSRYIATRTGHNPGGPTMSLRSEVITTYALCGFANFASIGIQIGGIGHLAPERRPHIAKLAFRALFAGTVACFMTACVAGMLFDDTFDDSILDVKTTISPSTITTAIQNSTTTIFNAITRSAFP